MVSWRISCTGTCFCAVKCAAVIHAKPVVQALRLFKANTKQPDLGKRMVRIIGTTTNASGDLSACSRPLVPPCSDVYDAMQRVRRHA